MENRRKFTLVSFLLNTENIQHDVVHVKTKH
jgi:hypothetical protein